MNAPANQVSGQIAWRWFIIGVVFLVVAIGFAGWAFYLKCLSQSQLQILQWALPIASGFMAWTFAGALRVEAKSLIAGAAIVATAGFGVWLLTFYFFIPKIVDDPECGIRPVSVSILRHEDLTGSGCSNGVRVYSNTMHDILTFSRKIPSYEAQAITRPRAGATHDVSITYEVNGKSVDPIARMNALPNNDMRYAVDIPVNGDRLSVTYRYRQQAAPQDDEWGYSVVSSLPINSFSADSELPAGVTVLGMNDRFRDQNRGFKDCAFQSGTHPSLSCSKALGNTPQVPISLYWTWDMWKGCSPDNPPPG